MYKQRIKFLGLSIWFICAFFYALEYFVRSSSGALYDSFALAPYSMSAAQISMSSSAFYLCYVLSQIPAGMLIDRYGIKRIMIVSSLLFAIAIYIASISSHPKGIILYRALAGLGGGFAFLCAIKSIALWLPNKVFPLFTGLTQFFLYTGAALSAGPLVILNNYYNISTIMGGIFIISLTLFFFSIFVIRMHPDFFTDKKKSKRKINAFLVLTSILKNKQIWLNGFYCFTIYGTTVLFADLWGIKYLKLSGFSADVSGTSISLIFAGVAIFSPIWGVIATVLNGERKPLLIAPLIGFFIVITLLYINPNKYILFILCILFGGCQAVHVLNYSALRNTVSPARIATALALVNLFLPLSGGTLQPITGEIIGFLSNIYPELTAFKITLAIIPVLMLLAFIISLFIKDSKS